RVPVGLDLRPFGDHEAELGEHAHRLQAYLREQVQMAAADRARRQRDIDLAGEIGLLLRARVPREALLDDLRALLLDIVRRGVVTSSTTCSNFSLTLLPAPPTCGRSPAGSLPSSFMTSETLPFLPRNCACAARIDCSSASDCVCARNSSPSFSSFAIKSGLL